MPEAYSRICLPLFGKNCAPGQILAARELGKWRIFQPLEWRQRWSGSGISVELTHRQSVPELDSQVSQDDHEMFQASFLHCSYPSMVQESREFTDCFPPWKLGLARFELLLHYVK